MSASDHLLSPESLLQHDRFVQAIARGLLGNAEEARDVAQDTWLKVLQRDATVFGSPKNWLSTVARNRARDVRRSERRRETRERGVARSEATESVDATYARLAAQRDVVAKILELHEPYKSVVILRYYDELSAEEIAQRLGSKPSTVRTQLARAHEILRAKLDAQYGDRTAWGALLLPVALPRASGVAVTVVACVLVMCIVSGGAWYALASRSRQSVGEFGGVADTRAQGESVAEANVASQAQSSTRTAIEPSPAPETLFAPALLFDRERYEDYEKSAFDFEHGLEDRVDVARTPTDLCLYHNEFDVYLGGNSRSMIVDLGPRSLAHLGADDLHEIEQRVAAGARGLWSAGVDQRTNRSRLAAKVGHTYFVWNLDADGEQISAFEVLAARPHDRCLLEWRSTKLGRWSHGSIGEGDSERSLTETLTALRAAARAARVMTAPRAILQVRSGAGGGNPNLIDLSGAATMYIDKIAAEPLDLTSPISLFERPAAFSTGGFIPEDQMFVVRRVTYFGTAKGDSNAPGQVLVSMGDKTLLDIVNSADPQRGEWTGRVELLPGQESKCHVMVRNSSAGEMRIEGEFVALPPTPRVARVAAHTPKNEPRDVAALLSAEWFEASAPRGELVENGARFDLRIRRKVRLEHDALVLDDRRGTRTLLADLGAVSLAELKAADAHRFDAIVREAARSQWKACGNAQDNRASAPASAGHTYFALASDAENDDVSSVFEVVDFAPKGRCTIDWYTTKSSLGAVGSLANTPRSKELPGVLRALRATLRRVCELKAPRVELQLRAGAGGGNPNRIDIRGEPSMYVKEVSDSPLDLSSPIDSTEPSKAYFRGGTIPADKQFVVTRVTYTGTAKGDRNGHGEFVISIGGTKIVEHKNRAEPIEGVWTGEIVLQPGSESDTYFQVANSSSGSVVIDGVFEARSPR